MNYSTEKLISVISQNRIFQNSSAESLKELINFGGEVKHFKRFETILSNQNKERKIGIILLGNVLVKKGKAAMSILKKSDIFGAVTLYSSKPNPPTTLIAKVECDVFFIEKENFDAFLWSDRKNIENFLSYLSDRIRFLTDRIENITAGDCETKLLSYLNSRQKNSLVTIVNYTDLAKRLDVGRASLYRVLDDLEKRGKIERKGKTIKIINEPK